MLNEPLVVAQEGAADNPWFSWDYVTRNSDDILNALNQHVTLTWQAIVIAVIVSLPMALIARRFSKLSGWIIGLSGVLYTIPSLALFAVLAPFTGIGSLTVLIGLVAYALLVLVRNILVGLQEVDPAVTDAARGMGYGPWQVLLRVEVPNALPTIIAGIRLATVTTVALATVGVVVGYGGLGQLMFRGLWNDYRAEVVTATLLCLALAFILDFALWVVGKTVTPWTRRAASEAA